MWLDVNRELSVNLEYAEQLRIDRQGKEKLVRVRTSTGGDFIIGKHLTLEDALSHLNRIKKMLPQLIENPDKTAEAKPEVPDKTAEEKPEVDNTDKPRGKQKPK